MVKTVVKGYAWLKAPEAMNGLRRSGRSLREGGDRLADRVLPARRRARRRREAVLRGAATAALSLPLGIWAGRRLLATRSAARAG
jgi:hypothetical protein